MASLTPSPPKVEVSPNFENINSRVQVAVMMDFTTLAEPIANQQVYESMPLSARMADRRSRLLTPVGIQ